MSDRGLHIDISKRVGALELQLSETWPCQGVTALFGPSGSGKTSVLRLIAGFEKPDHGRIVFGETVWCDTERSMFVPPHRRSVGFVHQGGHILPHLSVLQNLHFAEAHGNKRNNNKDSTSPSLGDIVAALDLRALETRQPETLSGGERQRVALAQALLGRPHLLLLDEPLSALDIGRKAELLSYLDQLQTIAPTPLVYVSHDVADIARLSDRVAVIKAGKIAETGETVQVLNRHGFQDTGARRSGTLFEGVVSGLDDAMALMSIGIGPHRLKLPIDRSFGKGAPLRIIVQASDVVISTQPPSGLSVQNALKGTIIEITEAAEGAMAHMLIDLDEFGGPALAVRITRAAVKVLGLSTGQSVYALVKTAVLAR